MENEENYLPKSKRVRMKMAIAISIVSIRLDMPTSNVDLSLFYMLSVSNTDYK